MVNMATRIMMGRKLSDFPYGTGLYKESDYISVKVPVFSFEKLHDVDTSLGPEMKSTGEVLGIAKTLDEAVFKGLIGSGMKFPEEGSGILFTVRDSDKPELLPIAESFAALGYELYATGNTAHFLNRHGIATNAVRKLRDPSPNLMDLVESGRIRMIVNTPTKGRDVERDGFRIRRKAVERSIPCLTSLDTAGAVVRCLKLGKKIGSLDIVNLDVFGGDP
jgi:carbamoyl-phosphate synthase large subunit